MDRVCPEERIAREKISGKKEESLLVRRSGCEIIEFEISRSAPARDRRPPNMAAVAASYIRTFTLDFLLNKASNVETLLFFFGSFFRLE